jgi:hypothetical protein
MPVYFHRPGGLPYLGKLVRVFPPFLKDHRKDSLGAFASTVQINDFTHRITSGDIGNGSFDIGEIEVDRREDFLGLPGALHAGLLLGLLSAIEGVIIYEVLRFIEAFFFGLSRVKEQIGIRTNIRIVFRWQF